MPPFVPNGVYKIRNVEFSRDVAGLIEEISIMGLTDCPGNPKATWRITNVGDGGNEIIIESVFAPGRFATAELFPNSGLFGTPEQTVWTIVKEDRGYYLQSPNPDLVWRLIRDGNDAPIVLSFTGQDNTKWTFDRVRN